MRKHHIFLVIALLAAFLATAAFAEGSPDCNMCHSDKAGAANLHPAVGMGCTVCHATVDASNIPHDFGGNAKGLMADAPDLCITCHDQSKFSGKDVQHAPVMGGMCLSCHDPHGSTEPGLLRKVRPDLCYDCHDKAEFLGPTIHAPVGIGTCQSCHEPHQSDKPKLLKADILDLCFNCHDSSGFSGKSVHAPVASGSCMDCHLPHAGQNASLLMRKGNLLCRKCHSDVAKTPHAVMGFASAGHPLRGRKDPLRSGKVFGCLSCHLPHASQSPRLFRYKADTLFDLCSYCHDL